MTRRLTVVVIVVPLLCALLPASPTNNFTLTVGPDGALLGSILPPGSWTVVFDEEFNGTSIDRSKWTVPSDYSVLAGTNCARNSTQLTVSGGIATFTGFDISGTPCPAGSYGGAHIWVNATWGPGYREARLKGDPSGWGGFWGANGNSDCGGDMTHGFEWDGPEYYGDSGRDNVFWDGYGSCGGRVTSSFFSATDDFHVWGLLYDSANGLTFYKDGVQTFTWNAGCSVSTPCTFPVGIALDNVMYFCCDASHPMLVDWIRVYNKN